MKLIVTSFFLSFQRFSTFITVTVSLLVGCVIWVSYFGASWHVAETSIISPYRAFSKQKIVADVGVYIGLQSVNISLKAKPIHKNSEEINFNERLWWIGPTEIQQEYQNALLKGLPYPILTISEYLSRSEEGLCWGISYRSAGYYSATLLVVAGIVWVLTLILHCAVPRYGIYALQITGTVMVGTNAVYALLLPTKPLVIPFEDGTLSFSFGWCYWAVLISGSIALAVGATLSIIDIIFPNKYSTILEVDYDTPYRYFVGNDAHLFGGQENGTSSYNHATATNSANTMSTCCAHLSTNLSLSKKKSDASTSTIMSIPVKTMTHESVTSLITKAKKSESVGKYNKAFDYDEKEGNESRNEDIDTTIIYGKRAVSLQNFGRFQQKEKEKDNSSLRHKSGQKLPNTFV